MPPKAKFSKTEITDAALNIVANSGIDALTARSLGEALGSSPRPIFTVFDSMEEVQTQVLKKAEHIYSSLVAEGFKEELPFKGVGMAYIRFAGMYPKLFQLLFMRDRLGKPDKSTILQGIDENYERILKSIEDCYLLDRKTSEDLYMHLWVYSHGIAVLIATGVCAFTPQQISDMISEVFKSLIQSIKCGGKV